MKKIFLLFIAITAIIVDSNAQTVNDWKELKAFHTVMSATYHPAEEGNLNPIKAKSTDLASKAEKMQSSLMPKEFDRPAIKLAVKKLALESKALNQLVKKKAKDAVILKSLKALHDRFHEIVGLCREEHH